MGPIPPDTPATDHRPLRVESAHDGRNRQRSRTAPGGHALDRGADRGRSASRDYITDRSLATAVFLALELGRPLLLEGEAGVGKTELAKVLAATPRRPAHPAPVLRGPRRQHRGLRVELPAPDARDPAARGTRRGGAGQRPRHLRQRLPDPPAAPPGARGRRRRRPGPAHRRDRPRRRGVRGVPARDPVRLPGHGAGDRHDQGRPAAARHPDLEPDARGPRRAQAPLPVPLDRLPDRPEGVRDRARPGARGAGAPGARGRRLRPSPARGRPDQGPGHRRDARLGGRAAVARGPRARARARRRDARRRPQVRGGHPPGPRRAGRAGCSPRSPRGG